MKFGENSSQDSTSHETQSQSKLIKKVYHKGPWTTHEDDLLVKLVIQYGPKNWTVIARFISNRKGKQCRERYTF